MEKNIEKIKKIVDDIYFVLICAGFLALICFYPIMLVIGGAFILFRLYVNDLYESKKNNEKYYGDNLNANNTK